MLVTGGLVAGSATTRSSAAAATSAKPRCGGPVSELSFVSHRARGGLGQIFRLDVDRRLAFTSHRSGDSDVWVVDVDGRNLRNLTRAPNALDDRPSWSPDGSRIAFGSSRDSSSQDETRETGDVYVMDANGRNVRRLTRAARGSYAPAWSPDGKLIAVNSQRDGNSELYLMKADGSKQRRLTLHPEPDGMAAWIGRGCR